MSTATHTCSHIAYEVIDDREPEVTVIEFRGKEMAGVVNEQELGEELDELIQPESPHRFVIDFANVHALESAAFGEIVSFARKVGRLVVCNLKGRLRLAAAMTDLDLYAAFAPDRQSAIEEARNGPMRGVDETADYPTLDTGEDETSVRKTEGARASKASKLARAAKASDEEMAARRDANDEPAQSPQRSVALAAGLTVEDFGGRSDAPGG
jgi:anti-anti-sigma regulatory factor